jgi:endonuclease/exonuclease/phosphatase family metal-dependent hydrolase
MHSRARGALVCALTLALALALAPAAVADAAKPKPKPTSVEVMTRNIYLGGNIFGPLAATTREEFERLAGALWAEVQHTNFPARAKLLAGEVKRTKPDLIGLQEVALWRRGPDGVKDGATTPATQVVYDFLATLNRELKRAGLNYAVAVKRTEADIEAPIDAGYDVRLTMRDVILVKKRRDLKITKRLSANYQTEIGVPTVGGTITSRRGWTAVDARLNGSRFRFVNTHLEAALEATRVAQAQELIAPGGPLRVQRPIILVGDFNSDPNGTESPSSAFDVIMGFGFADSWPRRFGPGFSCCTDNSDLSDTTANAFDHRIDLILSKPRLKALRGGVVGDETSDRSGGLWPSDHAGVVLTLRLP